MRDLTENDTMVYPTPTTSEDWVDGLDRTYLGRFAVPARLLYIADYVERMELWSNRGLTVKQNDYELLNVYDNHLFDELKSVGVSYSDVFAELHYWWEHQGMWDISQAIPNSLSFAVKVSDAFDPDRVKERTRQLEDIDSYQDYHDYFAAGIWDLGVIRDMVAHDIDAEMAGRL